jgi:hypothetical protein
VEIQPEQDTAFAAPVAADSPDDGNGQVSMSVTFTEVGQASSVADDPGLPSTGGTESAEDGSALVSTSGIAAVLVNPGNKDSNTQTTEGQSNETQNPASETSSGDSNEGQLMPVPTSGDSNSPLTSTFHGQDTMTDSKSPEETLPSNTQASDTGNTSVADTLPGSTQSPTTKAEDGTRTTTHGDDATSKPVADNSDTSSLQVSATNDQSSNKNTATTTVATTLGEEGDDISRIETQSDDIPPITSNRITTTAHGLYPLLPSLTLLRGLHPQPSPDILSGYQTLGSLHQVALLSLLLSQSLLASLDAAVRARVLFCLGFQR